MSHSESYISFTMAPILERVFSTLPHDQREEILAYLSDPQGRLIRMHIMNMAKLYLYDMLAMDDASPEDCERVRGQIVGVVSLFEAMNQYGEEYLADPMHRVLEERPALQVERPMV